MQETRFNIILGDCLQELAKLSANSVDCMIVDPPYGTTNLEFDKIKIDWKHWWAEVDRVCKPSAVQVCFAAQPFTTDLISSTPTGARFAIAWSGKRPTR